MLQFNETHSLSERSKGQHGFVGKNDIQVVTNYSICDYSGDFAKTTGIRWREDSPVSPVSDLLEDGITVAHGTR